MPAAPAIAAGASGAASMGSSKKAGKQAKNQMEMMANIFNTISPQLKQAYFDAQKVSDAGYDSAIQKVSGGGKTAKMGIAGGAKKASADARESAIGRGLFGTSYLDSLRRGITADAGRASGAVDENMAQMIAGLLQQKAGAKVNLMTGGANALANLGTGQANSLGSFSFQPQSYDFSGFAGLFGGQDQDQWKGPPYL